MESVFLIYFLLAAKIEVVKCPKDPREWRQVFQIYPVGINESVLVDLEMMCQCDCEKPGNPGYLENAPQCSGHGTYMCGICQCAPDFFGRKCECDAENLSFHGDLEAGCRPDNTTTTLCNNRGDCICGKCECYPRENPNEVKQKLLRKLLLEFVVFEKLHLTFILLEKVSAIAKSLCCWRKCILRYSELYILGKKGEMPEKDCIGDKSCERWEQQL